MRLPSGSVPACAATGQTRIFGRLPFNQSVILYEALRSAGKEVVFYKVEDGNHGWQFWSPPVMQIVENFLDEKLKR